MSGRHTPVLVVGGSLVGLSMSALLAQHDVPHLLVENHAGTAIHPRAASFHQRTMEIFRSLGVQQEIEEAASREFRQNGSIISVESLAGEELQYFYRNYNEGVEDLSPADRLFITQVALEPILRRRALELGAEHRFRTELMSFEQHEDHVTSVIRPRDGGPEELVTSEYLIGADGAHSRVRQHLGVPLTGHGSFADCVTIYFTADVNRLMRGRNLSVVYVNHPELLGFFRFSFAHDSGFLAVFATFSEDGTRNAQVGEDVSTDRCIALVRQALGCGSIPVRIENVQRWQASAAVAQSFRKERVFLVGDAAHPMPPTGGFGGNTGVADAHNLAWKLGYVTRNAAGEPLLHTYQEERRPVGELTMEQAYTRYVLRVDPSLPQDDLIPALDDASIELGATYRSSAVRSNGGPDGPLQDPRDGRWVAGARVPHLIVGGDGRSTLDLPGTGFALLIRGPAEPWTTAAAHATRVLGIPVSAHPLNAGVPSTSPPPDPSGAELSEVALVRPDGVVAATLQASTDDPSSDPSSDLAGLLGELLAVNARTRA